LHPRYSGAKSDTFETRHHNTCKKWLACWTHGSVDGLLYPDFERFGVRGIGCFCETLIAGTAVLCYASTRSPFSEGRQISEIETPLPACDLRLKSPSTSITATSVSRHRMPYHRSHQAKLLPPAMGGGVRYGVKSPSCRHTEAMFHLDSSTRSLHVRSPT
jgi:hypothetical protein